MSEPHHRYIICVLPDEECRPVRIANDFSVDLGVFCKHQLQPNYSLYYVSPSWIQRLPTEGVFFLSEEFTTRIPDFRLQFLPDSAPPYVLRLYPVVDYDLPLLPWNVVILNESDVTMDAIFDNFKHQFPVAALSFKCELEGGKHIPTNEAIMDHRSILKDTKVFVRVEMEKKFADKGKERMYLIKEIIDTEENYVKLLTLVEKSFNKQFFVDLKLGVNVFSRTFKSLGEIRPSHVQFLEALRKVGTDVEASIGNVFLKYMSLFKVASPHVSNYSAANSEIVALLRKNKAFADAAKAVVENVFKDKETVDGLLVIPVQRIPRYPMLLKQLLKLTPEIHWDYDDIQQAHDELSEMVKVIDSKKKEQDERNFVSDVQQKLGSSVQVLKAGRRGYLALEKVKINDDFKASLYLFNDVILLHRHLPQKFLELPLETTKLYLTDQFMVIDHKYRIPVSPESTEFTKKFQEAKREKISKLCTFRKALAWTADASGAAGLSAACMAEIDGDLYLFGGKASNGEPSSSLWRTRKGKWVLVEVKNEPSPRYECSMCSYEDKLIVFGGQNGCEFFNDLLVFDTKSCTWVRIDAMDAPSPRSGHCVAFFDTQLWLFGGRRGNEFYNDLYVFDVSINKWQPIEFEKEAILPDARAYSSAFWITDNTGMPNFALFGGMNFGQAFNDLWVFACDIWMKLASTGRLPSPRYGHVGVMFDQSIFIIGGKNLKDPAITDAYRLERTDTTFTWSELPQSDEPDRFVSGCCTVLRNYGIALYGGVVKQDGKKAIATYKIRLSYTNNSLEMCRAHGSQRSGQLTMSRPIYNPVTRWVTSTVDDLSSTIDFVLPYNEESLRSIMKCKGDKIYWCLTSVLDHDGRSTLCDSVNQFVLPETQFELIDKREREIVNEDHDGTVMELADMRRWKQDGDAKRKISSSAHLNSAKARRAQEKPGKSSLLDRAERSSARVSKKYMQVPEPSEQPRPSSSEVAKPTSAADVGIPRRRGIPRSQSDEKTSVYDVADKGPRSLDRKDAAMISSSVELPNSTPPGGGDLITFDSPPAQPLILDCSIPMPSVSELEQQPQKPRSIRATFEPTRGNYDSLIDSVLFSDKEEKPDSNL